MHLSTENLVTILESLTTRGSWKNAADRVGMSEQTCFLWLTRARKAEAAKDLSSPFWLEWRDQFDFWCAHVKRARRENILSLEALVRDEARNGQVEFVRDPATGRKIPQLDPAFLGVNDDEMEANMLDPIRDRWLWLTNEAGERVEPLWETKSTPQPASLRATVLRGLLPQTFGDKLQVGVQHKGAITHIFQPAPFVSRAERIERGESQEVVDAEFAEVKATGLERPDIELMRQKALAHFARTDRVTTPTGPVKDAMGNSLHVGRQPTPPDDPPERTVEPQRAKLDLASHPRSYQRSQPAPQRHTLHSPYPPGQDPRGKMATRIR